MKKTLWSVMIALVACTFASCDKDDANIEGTWNLNSYNIAFPTDDAKTDNQTVQGYTWTFNAGGEFIQSYKTANATGSNDLKGTWTKDGSKLTIACDGLQVNQQVLNIDVLTVNQLDLSFIYNLNGTASEYMPTIKLYLSK